MKAKGREATEVLTRYCWDKEYRPVTTWHDYVACERRPARGIEGNEESDASLKTVSCNTGALTIIDLIQSHIVLMQNDLCESQKSKP